MALKLPQVHRSHGQQEDRYARLCFYRHRQRRVRCAIHEHAAQRRATDSVNALSERFRGSFIQQRSFLPCKAIASSAGLPLYHGKSKTGTATLPRGKAPFFGNRSHGINFSRKGPTGDRLMRILSLQTGGCVRHVLGRSHPSRHFFSCPAPVRTRVPTVHGSWDAERKYRSNQTKSETPRDIQAQSVLYFVQHIIRSHSGVCRCGSIFANAFSVTFRL